MDEEINQFQNFADDFFEGWIAVFSREGVTNYIHLLAAGHILYFLQKHRCLYLFSQQGWEALNNKVQAYFHLCTQRGGYNSGFEANAKSNIFGIVRFIMRDLLWKTGEAEKFFIERENGRSCTVW